MTALLERFLKRSGKREKIQGKEFTVPSGVEGGPTWQVTDASTHQFYPIWPHQLYIEEVIQPLSLSDIKKARGANFGDWVLFDTPPSGWSPGNHWLVAAWDEANQEAELVFSNSTFGISVARHILPFKLRVDLPFFTGVAVQPITSPEGDAISHVQLAERMKGQPSETFRQFSFGDDIIYWAGGVKPHLREPELFRYINPQSEPVNVEA